MKTYAIVPIPKPRMTQRDRWAKRPPVLRYFAFCDEIRHNRISLPESGYHVTFVLPMPPSWSKKKRAEMAGKPHQQKPDADNLLKALMDAIYNEDCSVWDVRVTKRWGDTGEITIGEIA
ncbi:RusA family crossover junction endodeoxyribonuclease [Serratia fonticola]|uniref:RusA family crossover junction endodeoxyribonuclease n=1 Tax=Serratia fonticola TaxID=47917 RepID=UPI000F923694|nr:RusA family crossover junction endodeoxyribonuclease [Serratia fonticola]MDK2375278.1 RusA family crossover junction endodeoxyribonuclease [Serratia fonticola]